MKKLNAVINTYNRKSHINPEIYGHFSEHLGRCIYKGIFVGEDSPIPNIGGVRKDIIEAFRQIKMPVIRWPGGCFADEYHWMDGIGPKESRKKMVNTNWGGVTEDNSFGTNEFFNFCEAVGCEPYLSVNVGSGTVEEMANWIEYITFDGVSPMAQLRRDNGREKPWKLKYLGIGNENWGCGGNMRPEYYADVYRRFQTFAKNFSGNRLFKVACGPSDSQYNWTEGLLHNINDMHANAISMHYYTLPTGDWQHKGSSTEFDDKEYYQTIEHTLCIEDMIKKHGALLSIHTKQMKLIVDEWGCWYDVEPGTNPGFLFQQNTMRDAIVAAINLNIFNQHSDIVCMANIAQAVNVLQSLILTEGEKMVKTPTYHVFDMFKEHQGNDLVDSFVENEVREGVPAISYSASMNEDRDLVITFANCMLDETYEVSCDLCGYNAKTVDAQILTNEVHAHNDFTDPEKVSIAPYKATKDGDKIIVSLPPCSVVTVICHE